MFRLLRSRPVVFSAAAAAIGLAAFGFALAAPTGEPTPAAPGDSVPEATPSPAETPAPLPTPWPTPATKPFPGSPPAPPAGPAELPPLAVEPVRIHTGDGDCLNVRYLPGIPSGNDRPRDCLPEGTLLWLTGPAVDADGETWRWALGMGWVASRYTRPEPGVSTGFGPFSAAIVLVPPPAFQADWAQALRVTSPGAAPASPWLPFNAAWAGIRPGPLSPDGRHLAFVSYHSDAGPRGVVVEVQGGEPRDLPGLPVAWGPGSRLLLRNPDVCDTCAGAYALAAPPFTDPRPLPALGSWPLAWLPDGEHIIAWDAASGIHIAGTDGAARVIPVPSPDGAWPGELAVSPSGRYVVAVPFAGPIRLVDLQTGAVTAFDRPAPGPVGGRCGGSLATVAWLDDRTFAYHEAILGPGENGIVLVNRETGARRRLPFGTVFELHAAGNGLLAFTTLEYPGKDELQGSAPSAVSWLYDPAADLAWPAAPGLFAAWE